MAQSLPAQPSSQPGLPESADFIEFQAWEGIDTKPPRAGVAQNKCAWLDNAMPLGPNNIAAIPDAGDPIYTAPGGLTIIHYDFFGLTPPLVGDTGPYVIAFLSDGSAEVKGIFTGITTTLAPPGTFSPPTNTAPAVRQYGVTYLLIATEQSLNAYWIWDGAILYGPGTIGPEVKLTDPGRGYTSLPTITLVGGSGSGAAFTSQVSDGMVVDVTPTAAGSGWSATDPVMGLLLFSGGGSGDTAYATGAIADGAITAINIQAGGNGFTTIPTLVITDGTGSGAQAIVTGLSGGVITSVQLIDSGANYSAPTIATSGGGGTGFIATLQVQDGVINGYAMVQNGSGYLAAPTPFVISPSGSGFTATAVMSGGTVAGLNFGTQNFTGSGYSGTVLIGFTGGGGPAAGTVQFMPFGIHGYTIESYQSQVWLSTIIGAVKKIWSAPGSVVDFGPPNGGGAAPVTESNLRYQITRYIQSNGFLYEIGDSSTNYISGVQTSGSPAITTFSDLNIDPQIGSAWRDSCIEYSRAIVMANSFGVHAIYGGAIQKISTDLDGIYDSGTLGDVLFFPSSAVATVFGVHVYCLLLPITDPISGNPRNCIFMWDGKRWWSASQGFNIVKIAGNEWGGVLTAWGLDDTQTVIRPLFQTPSSNTVSTLVSRLAREPHIAIEKKGWMLYAMWECLSGGTISFTWDNENGKFPVTQGTFSGNGATLWARSKAPDTLGFVTGFTMTTNAAEFRLIDVLQIALQRRLKT